jgi:lipoprotein signal peptidase
MPISQETLLRLEPLQPANFWVIGTRLGLSKDRILAAADTNLGWLSDCLTLPQWFPYKFAFSLGDIFISIGAILLLWSLSRKEEEKV